MILYTTRKYSNNSINIREKNQIIPGVQRYIITYALSLTKPKFIRQMCLIANNCKTLHTLVIFRHASMIDIQNKMGFF